MKISIDTTFDQLYEDLHDQLQGASYMHCNDPLGFEATKKRIFRDMCERYCQAKERNRQHVCGPITGEEFGRIT